MSVIMPMRYVHVAVDADDDDDTTSATGGKCIVYQFSINRSVFVY